jgi:hypothetical protein
MLAGSGVIELRRCRGTRSLIYRWSSHLDPVKLQFAVWSPRLTFGGNAILRRKFFFFDTKRHVGTGRQSTTRPKNRIV